MPCAFPRCSLDRLALVLAGTGLCAIASLQLSSAIASPAQKTGTGSGTVTNRQLLSSPELWATVDACNPKGLPNTIGIRGSMPGNGIAKDTMYMSFAVQYYDYNAKRWTPLGQGASSGWQKVGSADVTRQSGRNFRFARTPGKPAVRLRGAVLFQWRNGTTAIATATRFTTKGHKSLAGSNPRGYSAGTCLMPQ